MIFGIFASNSFGKSLVLSTKKKYYIIAGEASGDLHGSNLMREMYKINSSIDVRFWGGDLMQEQGGELIKHYRDLAFMGFLEVVLNLRTILKNIAFCKEDIKKYKPDTIILIDYPGFNLKIAKFAKKLGVEVIYYISPQVWAWKASRVHDIKKYVDKMIVILPFEQGFYKKYDYKTHYVGHPLLDAIANKKYLELTEFRQKHSLDDKKIIAILPGSRDQEIKKMLPIMMSVCKDFKDYQFVVAGAPSKDKSFYKNLVNKNVKIVRDDTYNLLKHSTAALVTSGTATLEVALFGVPEVVCYKGNSVSYQIAKRIIDIKYISLTNLIMDKEVVKELIQNELNEKNLKIELSKILEENTRKQIINDYKLLQNKLGGIGASQRVAKIIMA